MAKAAVPPQTVALEALAQTLGDPTPRVLLGSGKTVGFFKGSGQAIKAAARFAEERGWVAGTGEWVGKGASKKQIYRLTPAGLQAILQNSETLLLLRSLDGTMQRQAEQFGGLRDQLGKLLDHLQPLQEVVAQLARRVEPPDVEQLLRKLTPAAPAAATAPSPSPTWLDEVVRLVTEQAQRDRYQPLTLPQIYKALQQSQPTLTLGQFHDGLRTLRGQRRIRLSPYTRALATIDDARNALFLDGEVMYYVELP